MGPHDDDRALGRCGGRGYKVRVEPGGSRNQKISTVARTPSREASRGQLGVFVTVKAGSNTLDPITLK